MVLLFQNRTKDEALSMLTSSLENTPIPTGGGTPSAPPC